MNAPPPTFIQPETTRIHSFLRSILFSSAETVRKWREQQRAVEDWDNMNKHMATIASSLLHQQISPILIKTLGYLPPPPVVFPSCQLQRRLALRWNNTVITPLLLSFNLTNLIKKNLKNVSTASTSPSP